jgi:hypothetical protein
VGLDLCVGVGVPHGPASDQVIMRRGPISIGVGSRE